MNELSFYHYCINKLFNLLSWHITIAWWRENAKWSIHPSISDFIYYSKNSQYAAFVKFGDFIQVHDDPSCTNDFMMKVHMILNQQNSRHELYLLILDCTNMVLRNGRGSGFESLDTWVIHLLIYYVLWRFLSLENTDIIKIQIKMLIVTTKIAF